MGWRVLVEFLLVLAFSLLGAAIGIITGLIPGFHTNNVSMILVSALPGIVGALLFLQDAGFLREFVLLLVCVMIAAISITHAFVSFIPGAFIGISDGEFAMSILPTHAMVLEGKGYEAIYLSAAGSMGAVIFALAALMPYRFIIGEPLNLYAVLKANMALILIFLCAVLIFTERRRVPYKSAVAVYRRKILKTPQEGVPAAPVVSESVSTVACLENKIVPDNDEPVGDKEGTPKSPKNRTGRGKEDFIEIIGVVENIIDKKHYYIIEGGAETDAGEKDRNKEAPDGKGGAGERHTEEGRLRKPVFIEDRTESNRDVKLGDRVSLVGIRQRVPSTYSRTLGVLFGIFVFALCGAFGVVAFRLDAPSPFGMPSSILFPVFAGLFGLSMMLPSLKKGAKIPKQKTTVERLDIKESAKSVLSGSFAGSIVGFLPGMSSSHATVLSSLFRKSRCAKQKILMISSIDAANVVFTLVALFLILRPRSGAAAAVVSIMTIDEWSGALPPLSLVYLLTGLVVAACVAYFATLAIGKKFVVIFAKLPYEKMIYGIIAFVSIMVFVFNGFLGIAVMLVAAGLGFVAPALGVRRSHAMGVLLVPIILGMGI